MAVKTADCVSDFARRRGNARRRRRARGLARHGEKNRRGLAIARMTDLYRQRTQGRCMRRLVPQSGSAVSKWDPKSRGEFAFWRPELAGAVEKTHLDLEAANQSQLEAAGVRPRPDRRSIFLHSVQPGPVFLVPQRARSGGKDDFLDCVRSRVKKSGIPNQKRRGGNPRFQIWNATPLKPRWRAVRRAFPALRTRGDRRLPGNGCRKHVCGTALRRLMLISSSQCMHVP